jgi:hypothetical protein
VCYWVAHISQRWVNARFAKVGYLVQSVPPGGTHIPQRGVNARYAKVGYLVKSVPPGSTHLTERGKRQICKSWVSSEECATG